MNETPYSYILAGPGHRYKFISKSPFKEVSKIVLINKTASPKVYNLAPLDELESGELSDTSEPDNKDFRTILATVFHIVKLFLCENPDCWVAFSGSDERRQRLYRIVISRELNNLAQKFVILGEIKGKTQFFEMDKPYDYFIIGSNL